jgi:hypothetical protein
MSSGFDFRTDAHPRLPLAEPVKRTLNAVALEGMGDLKSPKVIYLKSILFLLLGLLAAAGVILENPTLRTTLLLAIAVWAFCRAYYFAFYVIEHYIDPGFKFAGLGAFVVYLLKRRGTSK